MEAKCCDIAPPDHRTLSFPPQSRGGGIAFVINNLIVPFSSAKTNFSYSHVSFELVQLSFAFPHQSFHLFCLYRPPPSSKNSLKDSLFIEEFSELLTCCNILKGSYVICGDFNFNYDQSASIFTARLIDLFDSFGLVQSVRAPTHRRGHIIDWIVHCADQSVIKSLVIVTNGISFHARVGRFSPFCIRGVWSLLYLWSVAIAVILFWLHLVVLVSPYFSWFSFSTCSSIPLSRAKNFW